MKHPFFSLLRTSLLAVALCTALGARTASADIPTAGPQATVSVPAADSHINYYGRVSFINPAQPRMWWPGSAVELSFTGAYVNATLNSASDANEFTVVVDRNYNAATDFVCSAGEKTYRVADGLAAGKHTVMLWLRSETWQPVDFIGFNLGAGSRVLKTDRPKRKIEFFGDSIACGYGNEGDAKNSRTDANSDNFLSYSADIARALNAEYRCTARSGIAIATAWNANPADGITMPTYYDRLDPNVPHSWDFKRWTPDVVVIELGENDSGIYKLGIHPDPGPQADTDSYKNFVSLIRAAYPKAIIVCCLGPMDAVRGAYRQYETDAVLALQAAGDHNILPFVPLDIRTGPTLSGSGGHPNVAEDQAMADVLVPAIEAGTGWK